MASFNKVILMGNLTRDPELRATPNGYSICKFGVASSRRYVTQEGEQREEVAFVDVDAFGRQAENISKYFSKGKPIFIEGRLRFDQWETPSGEKRNKLNVVLENFQFVGGRQSDDDFSLEDSSDRAQSFEANTPAPVAVGGSRNNTAIDIDDDVPF